MTAAISIDNYLKITGVLTVSKPCLAYNNPTFLTKHAGQKQKSYCLLVLNTERNRLEGSVTWGVSGFDFFIQFKQNTKTKQFEIVYESVEHDNWQSRYDSWIDQIMEDIIKSSLKKVEDVIVNKENEITAKDFNGLYFRKKKIGNFTPRYQQLIDEAKSNYEITDDFYNFAKEFGKRFIAAKY